MIGRNAGSESSAADQRCAVSDGNVLGAGRTEIPFPGQGERAAVYDEEEEEEEDGEV